MKMDDSGSRLAARAVCVCSTLIQSAGFAQCPVSFDQPVTYPGGASYASGMVAGDFNRDGTLDLVTCDHLDGRVYFMRGNGNGSFQSPSAGFNVAGHGSAGLGTADFNADGNPDLVVSSEFAGAVVLLLGNGNGIFQPPTSFGAGSILHELTVSDLNGDGKPDVAVAANGNNAISVLLGNGNGSFAPSVQYAAGSSPQEVVAADLNGDSHQDLVVALNAGMALAVLPGNGDGTFRNPVLYPCSAPNGTSPDLSPFSVAIADLNRDLRPDVIVGFSATSQTVTGSVATLLGNASGTLSAPVLYSLGPWPANAAHLAVADFNRDGNPDLASANWNDMVFMLTGAGDGTFGSMLLFAGLGRNEYHPVAADFNGDGAIDVAVSNNSGEGKFRVFLNSACVPPPPHCPDVSGDGLVDFVDITSILTHWGTFSLLGDANGDGVVSFRDITAVLTGWGMVCG